MKILVPICLAATIVWSPAAMADDLDDHFATCEAHTHRHPAIVNGKPTGPYRGPTYDPGFEYCEQVSIAHESRRQAQEIAAEALAVAKKKAPK